MNKLVHDKEKRAFLDEEIWLLSILGGLGRTGVYSKDSTQRERKHFRTEMIDHFSDLEGRYSASVSSSDHVSWLEETRSHLERSHGQVFSNRGLPFGIVQKVFNLRLKYRWCMGWCAEPPHFPVDRIMLSHIYGPNPFPWTTMNLYAYMDAISRAERLAAPQSLAAWELNVFGRRR